MRRSWSLPRVQPLPVIQSAMTWQERIAETIQQMLSLVTNKTLQRIERKVDIIMSQLDDLTATLTAISGDVDTLESEFKAAQAAAAANQPVDLSGAIAAAQAIRTKLEAVTNPVPPPVNPPAA